MSWIVKNIFTLVKNFFYMLKKEAEIRKMLGRQVTRFLKEKYPKTGPTEIARKMMQDLPEEKITKEWVNNQKKSPSLTFIMWLERRANLNIEWLFNGEENKDLPMLKL